MRSQLARALRQALSASGDPASAGPAPVGRRGGIARARHEADRAGARPRRARDLGAGVFQVTVPRAEAITENGHAVAARDGCRRRF